MYPVTLLGREPYPVLFTLAVVTAVALALRERERTGASRGRWALVLGFALMGALVGMRSIFLDFQPVAPGEKTNLGGIIGSVALLMLATRLLRVPTARALDALTVPTLAGMAIGRIGCFLSGCCAGTETTMPWAVRDAEGHAVHPVQLYEAAADVAVIAFLLRRTSDARPGARMLAGSLAYALVRVGTEFFRAGRVPHIGLNLVQWSLLAIVVVLAWLWKRTTVASPRLAPAAGARLAWAIPAVALPRMAWMMMQAPVVEEAPTRELIVGSRLLRSTYDQTIGMTYGTDCDGNLTSDPTYADRAATTGSVSVAVRSTQADGDRRTLGLEFLAGRDRLRGVQGGPQGFAPRDHSPWAVGATWGLEQRTRSVEAGLVAGSLARTDAEPTSDPTGFLRLRLGDDKGWFTEFQAADPRFAPAHGEFSYAGIGFTGRGRDRPRIVLGIGQGVMGTLFVPFRGVELDLSLREVQSTGEGGGANQVMRVGLRHVLRR